MAYTYDINGEPISRKALHKWLSEEGESTCTKIEGEWMTIADYKRGEQVLRRLQRRAKGEYGRLLGNVPTGGIGSASIMYAFPQKTVVVTATYHVDE